jgi:hypothetical protein
MTEESETSDAVSPHPFAKMRQMVGDRIDQLTEEMKSEGLTSAQREKHAKELFNFAKLAKFLFDPESASARKSGDELKKEDDAIRAEFARRLAQILRGEEIRRRAEADGAEPPSPAAA